MMDVLVDAFPKILCQSEVSDNDNLMFVMFSEYVTTWMIKQT